MMDRPWDYNEGYEIGASSTTRGGKNDVSSSGSGSVPSSISITNELTGNGGAASTGLADLLARSILGRIGQSLLLGFAAGVGWHLSHALAGYLRGFISGDDRGGEEEEKEEEKEDGDADNVERSREVVAERLQKKLVMVWREALRHLQSASVVRGVEWPLVLLFGAAMWRGRGGGDRAAGGGGNTVVYPMIAAAWLLSSSRGRGNDDDGGSSGDRNGGSKRSMAGLEEELTMQDESANRSIRSVRGGLAQDVSHPPPSPSPAAAAVAAAANTATAAATERRPRSESVTSQATQTTVDSVSSAGEKKPPAQQKDPQRYFEMLVHNVSHTDLVLSLGCDSFEAPAEVSDPPYALCRPRFSAFDLFTRRVLDAVKLHQRELNQRAAAEAKSDACAGDDDSAIISFPRYERSQDAAGGGGVLVTPRTGRRGQVPVGFDLDRLCGGSTGRPCKISPPELPSLRMRGRDVSRLGGLYDKAMHGHWEAVAQSSPVTPRRGAGAGATVRISGTAKAGGLAHHSSSCLDDASGSSRPDAASDACSNSAAAKTGDKGDDDLRLNAVFFPLLSTLMRRWHETIEDKYSVVSSFSPQNTQQQQQNQRNVKKVVVLVSGVGTPRNWTHSVAGNSTEVCAELMQAFIEALYPDVTVVRLHSKTNIFRYDENISFAKRELTPCVDAYRDAHARNEPYPDEISGGGKWVPDASLGALTATASAAPTAASEGAMLGQLSSLQRNPFNPDWKQTFSVTLSFADGSPARTHAIQTVLRPYRPAYFHFWQLKTFWHDTKMCDDDVEVHSFEDMSIYPAMEVEKTGTEVQTVVEEMRKFRAHFLETVKVDGRSNDIRDFWLRKTKKPVLAVLLVNDPERGLILYRGTNMEVSMPTGSLCAERNVIGTALASDPALKREDLRMVAVLAVPLPAEEGAGSRRGSTQLLPPPVADANMCAEVSGAGAGSSFPSEVLTEVGRKLSSQDQQQPAVQMRSRGVGVMPRTLSTGSFASIVEEASAEALAEAQHETVSEVIQQEAMGDSWVVEGGMATASKATLPTNTSAQADIVPPLQLESSPAVTSPPGTPVRKVRLYRSSFRPTFGGGTGGRKKKRTVVVHSAQDINPLRPCGACNEWLKKIAESNPYFRVVTFTDADCNGVYVTPCQD